jgi:hypothetical protein
MFNIIFSRPTISSVNITQISDAMFKIDCFSGEELLYSNIYPIYSNDMPNRVEDPERVFAREQWNNLI